tara:strand:- start:750 stop:1172 length:423 start_codon:yes stop_codon:yes gene_type:complete
MKKPSEMRFKLARFVERKKVCPECLEAADCITIRGDIQNDWRVTTVSNQLQTDCLHQNCETWIRLSLWLQGELNVSFIPWVDLHAYISCNLYLEPKEKKWSQIFLLMEEEMEHMIRDVILKVPCTQHQEEWEKEWMEKMS